MRTDAGQHFESNPQHDPLHTVPRQNLKPRRSFTHSEKATNPENHLQSTYNFSPPTTQIPS